MVRASRTGKPSPGEAGTLKIHIGFFPDRKALSRETRQNRRRGSGASSLPESLIEEVRRCARGRARRRLWADLGKELERAPGGLGEKPVGQAGG